MSKAERTVDPHKLGYCCRHASNTTCVGCGDAENGLRIKTKRTPAPTQEKEKGTPLSEIELSIVRKMQANVTFVPATSHKRFVRDLSERSLLTTRGRSYLAYIGHRYRRQWFHLCTDAEMEWLIARKAY